VARGRQRQHGTFVTWPFVAVDISVMNPNVETNHKVEGFAKASRIEILRAFGSNPEGLEGCRL